MNPAPGLTCDCATPGTATSIGSSSVARLRRPWVVATRSRRQAYCVVVLPLPAGPLKRIAPEVAREEPAEGREDLGGEPQVVEPLEPPGAGEEPDDGLLAVERRERAEPHLDDARRGPDAALLRDVVLVRQQLGQHLEPGHDLRRGRGRQDGHRVQDAVEPPADVEPVGRRLEVDVAGAQFGRGPEQQVHRLGRVRPGLRRLPASSSRNASVVVGGMVLRKPFWSAGVLPRSKGSGQREEGKGQRKEDRLRTPVPTNPAGCPDSWPFAPALCPVPFVLCPLQSSYLERRVSVRPAGDCNSVPRRRPRGLSSASACVRHHIGAENTGPFGNSLRSHIVRR